MKRPDFNELVAAPNGGSSKGVELKPIKPNKNISNSIGSIGKLTMI